MSTINYTSTDLVGTAIWDIRVDSSGNVYVATGTGGESGVPYCYARVYKNGTCVWSSQEESAPYQIFEIVVAIEALSNGHFMFGVGSSTGDARAFLVNNTNASPYWKVGDGNVSQVVNIGDCQEISMLKQISNGVVFAASDYATGAGRLFRSTDNGATFTQVTLPDQSTIELIGDVEDCGSGIVLLGIGYTPTGNGDIYRSTDWGLTFTKIHLDSYSDVIDSIKYLGGGIVLAASGYELGDCCVYKSTDYGQTWTRIRLSSGLERVHCLAYAGNGICYAGTGFASSHGNVWKSADYGSTWSQITTLNGTAVLAMAWKASTGQLIFGTYDWTAGSPYKTTKLWTGTVSASPTISSISPSTNVLSNDTLTITGTDFFEYTSPTLLIDDVDYTANITSYNSTTIAFTSPVLAPGNHTVKVRLCGTTSAGSTITYATTIPFKRMNQTPNYWHKILKIGNDNWALPFRNTSTNPVLKFYKQTDCLGDFVEVTGITARIYTDFTSNGTNIYAITYNGDGSSGTIYKMSGMTGDFVEVSGTAGRAYSCIYYAGSDIYAAVGGYGNVYVQWGGSGNFVSAGSYGLGYWNGLSSVGDGYVYGVESVYFKYYSPADARWFTKVEFGAGDLISITSNGTYCYYAQRFSDHYIIWKGNYSSNVGVQTIPVSGSSSAYIRAHGTDIYLIIAQVSPTYTYIYKQTNSTGSFDLIGRITGVLGTSIESNGTFIWVSTNSNQSPIPSDSYAKYDIYAHGSEIYSVTPNTDLIYGQDITISGRSTQGDTSTVLKIDGTTYSTTSVTDSAVHFNAPNLGPGTKSVKLVIDGTDTNAKNISYPLPSITSITPNSDLTYGDTLTITGKGLLGVNYNTLWIDGVDYTSRIISETSLQIVFTAPNLYPGSHTVTVQVDGGDTSNGVAISYPMPTITSISPSTGIMGGNVLTITGKGLLGVAYNVLLINGVDYTANILTESATSITFTAPDLANGTYDVQVKNGTDYGSNLYPITYAYPDIISVDPASEIQHGALITVTGENLQGSSTTLLKIGASDYSGTITSTSPTKITFVAPVLADGTYSLTVVSDGKISQPYPIIYTAGSTIDVSIRSPYLYQHFENDDGTPVSLGKVYTYYAGTTTPLATLDFNGVENPNPVYLDAAGNADIYLQPGYAYKFLIMDANDVLISSGVQDNITGASNADLISGTGVTVETIAALKLLTAGSFNYATVLGYYAKTDSIGPRLYYWDSASTLTDDGGSVIKITASATGRWKLVAGKEIDAKWFGATGNGTTNDYQALYNANLYLTAIGGGKLILSYGSYNITSALTLGANVELVPLPGAYFKSTNGSALTINNMALTGNSKRFDSTLGTISFGNMVDYILPEWFGAVGDGTTDDSSSIQKALNSCAKVVFSAKTYKVTTGLTANVSQEIIGGDAILSPNANSITVLGVPQCSTAADAVKISRLNISNAGTKTGVIGLSASRSSYLNLSDVYVKDVETGISLSAGQNQNISNLSVKGCSSVGLKLVGPAIEDFIGNDFNSVTLDGNQVGLMAYTGVGGSSALKNITFNGINLVNNTVAGGYFKDVVVSMTGLQLYSNGSGAASCTIDSKTIYKSDLYLDAATVSINDSEVDTGLNNSIQLINSACLNTNNFTGYSSTSNTQILCDATSRVVESGYVDATGYRNNIQKYGELKSISHPFICDGAGLAVITMSMENHGITFPQYFSVNTTTGATSTHDKTGKGLTKKVTFNTVVGSQSVNSASPYLATDFSKTYQITTLLIRAVSGSPLMTIEWNDNSTSWSHNITLQSNGNDWTRLVFITKNKTTHKLYIYPADTSGPAIYLSELMEYDTNNLDAISAIYSGGLVAYSRIGNYYSGAPSYGSWIEGDIVYNMAPTSSAYIGWTCTAAGTPGTWKTFGLIS